VTRRELLRSGGAVLLVAISVLLELTGGVRVGAVRNSPVVLPFAVVAAATTAVYLRLLLRWRHPLAVYTVLWVYSLAGLLLERFTPFVGLVVALHAVASLRPIRSAGLALAAAAVPLAISAGNGAVDRKNQGIGVVESWAGQLALYAVVATAAWGIGRLSYAAAARAEDQRRAAAAEAIHAERIRLARELHDIVSHFVTVMVLQAAGAKTLAGENRVVGQALSVIETAGVQAMSELHRLLGLLRAVEGTDDGSPTSRQPTLEDIGSLVDLARSAGLDVAVDVVGAPGELDPSVSLAGYRVVQEALTNSVRYAGRGASVEIRLEWAPDMVKVTVRDHGRPGPGGAGPDASAISSGQGLRGLQDRVTLVGGRLEVFRVRGGFVVSAELPCVVAARTASAALAFGPRPGGTR
jgi:signal transduction histidine kinase